MKTFKQFINEASGVGFHYGDLKYGRDTALGRMGGRSTGHFGTGVYFLGTALDDAGPRGDRPVKKIDLTQYNLARPRGKDNAKNLHDGLKKVNWAVSEKDEMEKERLIRKAAFDIWLSILPGYDDEQIRDMITKAVEETEKDYPNAFATSDYIDSASTRVMKMMGYDGVDVRGIPGFDNTDYGSVIYAQEL